jgi:hypothetical protein
MSTTAISDVEKKKLSSFRACLPQAGAARNRSFRFDFALAEAPRRGRNDAARCFSSSVAP